MITPTFAFLEGSHVIALVIPLAAIVFGCGIPITAIVVNYRRRKHLFELYHQERMAAISKGIDLPPLPDSMVVEDDKPRARSPRESLLKGLVWLFVGLAIFFALGELEGREAGFLGLIPAGVGLAHLIYYFVEGRNAPVAGSRNSVTNGPKPE